MTAQEVENTNVDHSRFVAEAPARAKWKETENGASETEATGEDSESITEGKGKLSPTSSHLFKLILPLGHLRSQSSTAAKVKAPPPTVFLLHPSQPLSHVARLILAQMAPDTPSISFRSTTPSGRTFRWADSTDVGDFIRDAARATEFTICIGEDSTGLDDSQLRATIHVEVPSFADRTRFLRRRLAVVEEELLEMEALKRTCDREAHRGARRMAVGGLAMLVVYWGAVARLTFWDLGWDIMEPVTYLSGLCIVIMGYLWFLYQGREVTYSSVLQHSVSARRDSLYKARGLDVERWLDLVSERKTLRTEIGKIAEDYDERVWKARQEERDEQRTDVRRREERGADQRDAAKGVTPVPDSEGGECETGRASSGAIDEPLMDPLERPKDGDEGSRRVANTKA
ncbi:hypothetical protein DAEQUDRAFT_680072 [Daedalea quercina L-15889]|uniref:Calcium uniporter protein, mitochondrial n=1 Tax=Daedalea quercina L-15889 TaxID=1314783 RepID=A0A165KUV1_9APHY|nr:hypothetical protein DAEQUDRAFT_680072 [Daedalea quercina L-15889]